MDHGEILGRIGFWWRSIKLSILPRPRARRRQHLSSGQSDEYSEGGYGELNGDDLARSHGLVLPRSRWFGDKQPPRRSWATSSGAFMSHNSNAIRSGDLDSLPSWVSDHLGEGSPYMTDEELNALRDTYSFPSGVQIRLPDEGKTITSTRPGEVAFYEAAFPTGLRFPLHNTNRLILQFYNICPAQLVPNAWKSIACSMALWRVYRYSISLSEFRNLFSLNSNPKPDQGWLYFKARNKKVLLGGYPSNVKGWKSKFFFVSGDEWEIPEEKSRKGAARVPRTWGIPNKHCNNPPRLFDDEMKVFEEIFRSVEESGRFSVPVLLDSKSFCRVFASSGSRASRTAGDHPPSGEVVSSSSDVGESRNPHEQARRESPSRDDSIVCLGSFRTELRRLLPHIPDLTLLRWTGGKRVSFKKIGEKLGKAAGASWGTPAPAKGVVISEKRARENITSSPSKKAKADDGSKGKGVDIGPEGKKKASSLSKTSAAPTVVPSRPGEGTSAHLGAVPGPAPSILGSPSVAERLLRGREAGEQAPLQEGRVASMETESLDELAKAKGDRDSLADHLGKSGALVNELRKALNKAKESAVEEFKSSSEFMVAVEDAASKYFGEGFNFCKVQLRRHHPDLAIDLEGTAVDQDLLAELDEAEEENDKEKTGEHEGGKK
ncbi:hypothetical protein Acr_27g0000720 [Actinidia rufa]|uniref:Transposase (putative) gypsy type domain-containing protein n=1 Tax=Actinidia rufa TaxID=165716 RepID=A0A7J0H5F3_9ERIC|nr:hypothetical protein Acr_27g0000720 [Actinidia rufa]